MKFDQLEKLNHCFMIRKRKKKILKTSKGAVLSSNFEIKN